MQNHHILLFPEKDYHILGQAIGNEKIFRESQNYSCFLERYDKHVSPIADTLCYCLLPNHFHLLIRIKSFAALEEHFALVKENKIFSENIAPDFIMERFSNFLNSYTKSYNNKYDRKGSLFIDYLRRTEISCDNEFGSTVFHIHRNPVHHQYCKFIEEWTWSSYHEIIDQEDTFLKREKILNWFGGKQAFIDFHHQVIFPRYASITEY